MILGGSVVSTNRVQLFIFMGRLDEALKLAHCDDGPPYYYKVAYDEAERIIARMKDETI